MNSDHFHGNRRGFAAKCSAKSVLARPGRAAAMMMMMAAAGLAVVAVRASDIEPGVDLWQTPAGATYDVHPIPAGFFTSAIGAEGSNAYTAGISFVGVPVTTNPAGALDRTDTIVQRPVKANLATCPSEDTIPIEIVALSLTSVAPITVTYPTQPDELWQVDVCLAPNQPQGSMTIRHECPLGGTYDASLQVLPEFTFTRINPADGTMMTWIPPDPVVLDSNGGWTHLDMVGNLLFLPAGTLVDTDCDSTPDTAYGSTVGPDGFFPGMLALDCTCNSPGGGFFRKRLTPEQELLASHGVYVANTDKSNVVGACCWAGGCEMAGGSFHCTSSVDGTYIGDGIQCDPDPCSGTGPLCGDGVCASAAGEDSCTCPLDCGTPPAESCTDGADNDCDGDVDCADADCATDPACGTTKCAPPGDDCFTTQCNGNSFYDFSGNPIPAGFFGPGSDPFTGTVVLGGPGGFPGDTIVRRLGQMCFPDPLPHTEQVPIELVQLSLVSCSPIVVTYNGGLNPQQWQVTVQQAPTQAQGLMRATKTHPDGGVYTAQLPVSADMLFQRLDGPGTAGPLPANVTLNTGCAAPWTQNLPVFACSSAFQPGFNLDANQQPCCQETCHEGPAPDHQHCTTPADCNPCLPVPEDCTNLIDDDNDGLCDCEDPDCAGTSGCVCQCSGTDCNANGMDDTIDLLSVQNCVVNGDCSGCSSSCNNCDINCDGVLDGNDLDAATCFFQGIGPEICCAVDVTCCLPDGTCATMPEADCAAANGKSQPAGAVCQGDNNNNQIDDLCEAAECEECGPGPHWIDQTPCPPGDPNATGICKLAGETCLSDADCKGFCSISNTTCLSNNDCTAAGETCIGQHCNKQSQDQDTVPSGAVLGIDLNGDCVAETSVVLGGPATIRKIGPRDDSTNFPGTRPIDAHKDVVDTEIIQMTLSGGGVTLLGGGGLGGIPLAPSLGAVAEQPGDPSLADSFFDVFVELSGGGLGAPAYNQTPIHVATVVPCLPPKGNYIHVTGCTPLYDSPIPGQGNQIANLVQAKHFTFPACCRTDGTCVNNVSVDECATIGGTTVPACLGDADGNGKDDACEVVCERDPTTLTGCTDACPDPALGLACLPSKAGCNPNQPGTCGVLECECQNPNECHLEYTSSGAPVCLGGCSNVPGGDCRLIGDGSFTNPYHCECVPPADCAPNDTGTGCVNPSCPDSTDERCVPRCVRIDPAVGVSFVTDCDCRNPQECHVESTSLPGGAGSVAGVGANPCVVPDNGTGTVTLPPAGCDYLSPDEVHEIIDGLPAGTTIELAPIHTQFICRKGDPGVCSFVPDLDCTEAGGTLGGDKECAESTLQLSLNGTGALAGYNRAIALTIDFETHTGPRMLGDPVQSFDTDMFRMFGQLPPGDPDFDLLRITAGTDFGLPSPGHTTLTQLPGGNWAVDSFFDITYRIDFVGAAGGPFGGMSGSTTGTIRMDTGSGSACVGACPPGTECVETRTVNSDGTIDFCCDCVQPDQACCLPDGTCAQLPPDECKQKRGKVLPVGSLCLGDNDGDGIDDACGADPCEECGPGIHWIDTPPCPAPDPNVPGVCKLGGATCLSDAQCPGVCSLNGDPCISNADCTAAGETCQGKRCNKEGEDQDTFPSGALLGIDTNLDCIADTSLVLGGPATVHKLGPHDDSTRFPGLRPTDAHKDVIDTEILAMNLTGGGVTLVAGSGLGALPLLPTYGAVAELQTDPSLADSFFDVFAEVAGVPGGPLYNQTPIRVRTVVPCLPPKGKYIHFSGCTPLYDTPFPGLGNHVANLVRAQHFTFPDCCLPDGTCQPLPVEQCKQLLGTPVAQCLGDSDGDGHDDACDPPDELCPLAPNEPWCADRQGIDCLPDDPTAAQFCRPLAVKTDPATGIVVNACDCYRDDAACGPVTIRPIPGTPEIELLCEGVCPDGADRCLIHLGLPPGVSTGQKSVLVSSLPAGTVVTCDCPPEEIGACCLQDGTCAVLTLSECRNVGGVFQGAGTDCTDSDGNGRADVCEPDVCEPTSDGSRCQGPCEDDPCFGECINGAYCDAPDPGCCLQADNCLCYARNTKESIQLCGDCFGECINGAYCDNTADPDCCIIPGACACYLPNTDISIQLCQDNTCFGECINGSYCDNAANPNCCINPGACACYTADHPISVKLCARPLPTPERCQASCVKFNPLTGESTITDCDCSSKNECHVDLPVTAAGGAVATPQGVAGNPCVVADNGTGTVTLPPAGCEYLSPDEVHQIIDGLPPGTTIELAPIHKDFICQKGAAGVCSFFPDLDCSRPGGSLGGDQECVDSTLHLNLNGTGVLAGFMRMIPLPISFETHTGPRMLGDPVQSFDTDMFRMFGQITGDPDFDLLRITAGTDFGMPSPGHTTLTRLPSGDWHVDSFFDITYRIDFVGAPGGPLGGMSGSTTGTIRMTTGAIPSCTGGCPVAGQTCSERRTLNADGTIDICCTCGCPADPVDPPKPEPVPNPVPKNRYLSMVPNNPGRLTALRVTVVSSSTRPTLNGSQWWVSDPQRYCENAGQASVPDPAAPPVFGCGPAGGGPRAFQAATLDCAPDCRDWGAAGLIDVYHPAVVPGTQYVVQAIDCSCLPFNDEGTYSAPLTVTTSRWGDVLSSNATAPPGPPNGIVDIGDVVGVLNKFKNLVGAMRKARADVEPALVDRLIQIPDVTRVLDAFVAKPYPFPAPPLCP